MTLAPFLSAVHTIPHVAHEKAEKRRAFLPNFQIEAILAWNYTIETNFVLNV